MISPAMATLISIAPGFIEKKIRNGCKVRILLPNPDDEQALHAWRHLNKAAIIESRIRDTLRTLGGIIQTSGTNTNCQVKLSDVFSPFSMFAVDLHNNLGTMVVEYHCYKTPGDLRPHIFLTAKDDLIWFTHYRDQFDLAWSEVKTSENNEWMLKYVS